MTYAVRPYAAAPYGAAANTGYRAAFTGSGSLTVGAIQQAFTVVVSGSGDLTMTEGRHDETVPAVAFDGSGILSAAKTFDNVYGGPVALSGAGFLDVAVDTEHHSAPALALTGIGTLIVSGNRFQPAEMVLQILDSHLQRAPTAVTVVIAEARPNRKIEFYIDDVYVAQATADADGFLSPYSINIPEYPSTVSSAGSHHLKAEQSGSYDAEAEFELDKDPQRYPIAMGPDAQAVEVPEAVRPNGTRAWVLQDLYPAERGGLGSYVMPLNPIRMTNPYLEFQYTVHPTTVPVRLYGKGGQFHVMQGGPVPKQWTFEGYCPTQDMQNQLLAYKNLNRRFYVIDHRNRAWIVAIQGIDFRARHRQQWAMAGQPAKSTDWGHDYTVTATVLDQQWVNPASSSQGGSS